MDIIRAREILQALADGVNPMTGEVLPAEDSCNQPDVIRALLTILAPAEAKEKKQPENHGAKWTKDEMDVLIAEYEGGMSLSKIAKRHGRSRGAIEYKLAMLGKRESSILPRKAMV